MFGLVDIGMMDIITWLFYGLVSTWFFSFLIGIIKKIVQNEKTKTVIEKIDKIMDKVVKFLCYAWFYVSIFIVAVIVIRCYFGKFNFNMSFQC